MTVIGDILKIRDNAAFEKAALNLFRRQATDCSPYREYISGMGIEPEGVGRLTDIPFLPIELFKTHKVYCGAREPEIVFTSSSTTGINPSRHYMARVSDYIETFTAAFSHFFGSPEGYGFYALLPNYLEREGSSLVFMADRLINRGSGGFYLYDFDKLENDLKNAPGKKILLGVTYALLDYAVGGYRVPEDTIVMETGGMKGRREEITKEELHAELCGMLGVDKIYSEYGMAELMSQAYSFGGGIYNAPPWMKVMVRDVNDPFDISAGPRSGAINIIDLANVNSCAFIQTHDLGELSEGGCFRIAGRMDRSEVRGCNLMVG